MDRTRESTRHLNHFHFIIFNSDRNIPDFDPSENSIMVDRQLPGSMEAQTAWDIEDTMATRSP
jgi:hypothetical protein